MKPVVAVVIMIKLLVFLLLSLTLSAQIPVGSWRVHPDFLDAKGLEIVEEKVYCYSENGFFVYDINQKEAVILSKIDGLASMSISALKYIQSKQLLLIGYQNGEVDFAKINKDGSIKAITSISTFLESNEIIGSKKINDFDFFGEIIYTATDFGIAILSFEKNEVVDLYRLYQSDLSLAILKIKVLSENDIKVQTLKGVFESKVEKGINLKDFANWQSSNYQGFNLNLGQNVLSQKVDSKGNNWQALRDNGFFNLTNQSSITPASVNQKIESLHIFNQKIVAQSTFQLKQFLEENWVDLEESKRFDKDKLIDASKNEWSISFGDLVAYNPTTAQTRRFGSYNSSFINGDVISLNFDRVGALWIGTTNGVSVLDNPSEVFSKAATFFQPESNNKRLFFQEKVFVLAFDAANRKWVGTSSGVYFLDENNVNLSTFNIENSPLPSNEAISIAIDDASGEVFFLSNGLVLSYRSDATTPSESLANYVIFPNPVTPNFEGVVTFSGLTDKSTIKLIDFSGRVLKELQSNGGTTSWNLLDNNGRTAETGIYFVLMQSEDKTEKLIGKLAIVR